MGVKYHLTDIVIEKGLARNLILSGGVCFLLPCCDISVNIILNKIRRHLMTLVMRIDKYVEFLNYINLMEHGDFYEREYFAFLKDDFPNYENFWRWFVVPLTQRLEGEIKQPGNGIYFRKDIDPKLKEIAAAHYSLFMHLGYAHWHLEHKVPSCLENVYAHLATVCDLIETILEKWYLILIHSQGKQSKILQKLSKEEFLDLAGEWYDQYYGTLYDHYYSKGKHNPIKIPNKKYIILEYMPSSEAWKDLSKFMNLIRAYRNKIVHNTVLGRLITKENIALVPNLELINYYPTWEEISSARNVAYKVESDFSEMGKQIQASIQGLEKRINKLWAEIIDDFKNEFFAEDRTELRNLFGFEFLNDQERSGKDEANQLREIKIENFSSATSQAYINDSTLGSANYPASNFDHNRKSH